MRQKTALGIIFTTVAIDLIGFGIVIPLVGIYGRHYGASALELGLMGSIYSIMQFFFSPLWGSLSDRFGRRPILLGSLLGSCISYLLFAFAPGVWTLILSRAFSGIFAANVSTAQAYVADVTPAQDRAKGMGLIGAAFGIGFTLGPPVGGIVAKHFGLAGPGVLAALICGLNFSLALFRLPESLTPEVRARSRVRGISPFEGLGRALRPPFTFYLLTFFFVTFAFSNMEQTFSLLFQTRFGLETAEAGYRTGLVLMWSGILGALIQGGLIRRLVPRFGEMNLLVIGFICSAVGMFLFPLGTHYTQYFALVIPIALGSSLANPSLYSLISQQAQSHEQGETFGITQGMGSLARAAGPFCGLLSFSISPGLPFQVSGAISSLLLVAWATRWLRQSRRLSSS